MTGWMLVLLGMMVPGSGSAVTDPGPEKKSKSDYDRIIERNIFAPPSPKKADPVPERTLEAAPAVDPAPKLPEWRISGIFFRESKQDYRVIAEHAEEGSRVAGNGEMIGDTRIIRVEQKKVWVEDGEEGWSLRPGDRFGEPGSETMEPEGMSQGEERSSHSFSSQSGSSGKEVRIDDARRQELLERLRNRRKRN